MARRSKQSEPDELRQQLLDLLTNFGEKLASDDLRTQVRNLIPVHHLLRDLGSSLLPRGIGSGQDRILHYLKTYPRTIIEGEELMIVAGIEEWARRTRELRVELGYPIVTGASLSKMAAEEQFDSEEIDLANMKTNEYILLDTEPDRDAAYRWQIAKRIKKKNTSVQNKILEYLRENVGKPVQGEELRELANKATEWARRVRELRTEEGWPIVTKQNGMPELPVGTYMLELDRRAPPHDHRIPDKIRRQVLRRDDFQCCECHWHIKDYNRADTRILELHHIKEHAKGGSNEPENLKTLCNVCHDAIHAESD